MVTCALLLLADSRLPAGGHAHSGGVEQAVARGDIGDLGSLESFLRGRLATAGFQAACVSAFACTVAGAPSYPWHELDAEVSARMPSPAQRAASRAQGKALLRVVDVAWPSPLLARLGERPHQGVVLGVATAVAGAGPLEVALVAATAATTGPASAALRLLGLDPVEVTALLARLGPDIDCVGPTVLPLRPPRLMTRASCRLPTDRCSTYSASCIRSQR